MKQAIAVTELMIFILAILAGTGLLFFGKKTVENCQDEVELCRNSYATFQSKMISAVAKPRIDCLAVSPPNCNEKVLKTDDKEDTMFIIAENLRWCWYKTLEQKNKIGEDFGTFLEAFGVRLLTPDVDFCLVCSEFTPNVDVPASEWDAYLADKKIPRKGITYGQYISPALRVWGRVYNGYPQPTAFEKGTKYFVVSVSAEEEQDGLVGLYISPNIFCGTKDPQVHYQRQ
jgi:hypothetical protein